MEYMIFTLLFLLGMIIGRAILKITTHLKDIEADFENLKKEIDLIKFNRSGIIGISNNLPELLREIKNQNKEL